MKKSFLFLLLAAMALTLPCNLSCTKTASEDEEEEKPVKPEEMKLEPGIYTFTVSPLKGQWEAGDKIYVHGAYGPYAQMITLTAADISTDGKTASAQLDDVTKIPVKPDGLYAAWPGDAVITGESVLNSKTQFSRADIPLAAAYLSGTSFAFKDVSCGLRFKASGYTDFAIAGNTRSGICFTDYEIEYTSDYAGFYNIKNDGYPFLTGTLTDGSVLLWFPSTLTFKEGYTIYLGNNGEWPATYSVSDLVKLQMGQITDLGDITEALEPYDGPEPKMPVMGKMTTYSVSFNELSGLCVSGDGDFLWALGDGSEIAKISFEGEVLKKAYLKTTTGSTIDSEGISVNYDTGDLLISGEPNVACKIPSASIPDIFSQSTFKGVVSLFNIADAKNFGNAGAEGCTYYKDGQVYIGTQTGSYLYRCNLETGEVLSRNDLRDRFHVITEIAGLSYDPLTDWLWIVDSEAHKFFVLSGDGEKLLGAYTLKTKSNEESICVDHANSCVWIGDDYGSTSHIYKYEFTGLDDAIIK